MLKIIERRERNNRKKVNSIYNKRYKLIPINIYYLLKKHLQ